ncbi:MAG: NAD(P)/FAD-dependent oxidoreductase [Bacteroidota bacterium]
MVDVAIIGGGPAGLQAALVLARTRKDVIVFDSTSPPRNGASHGVHNVLGLDGLLPAEIRSQAWAQINVYQCAGLRKERVDNIEIDDAGVFVLSSENGTQLKAKRVIIALGYEDIYPSIEGFSEAWANTIIPCPFCDGYENRDRVWGLVINSAMQAAHFPALVKNWTASARLILNQKEVVLDVKDEEKLRENGFTIHAGSIVEIEQVNGNVKSVKLDTGEVVEIETLWWAPARKKSALEEKVIRDFQLSLDEMGLIQTDESGQTDVKGLYAVGDVAQMPPSALGAMVGGNTAALSIIRAWFG